MMKITCASVFIAISACLPAAAQTVERFSAEELIAKAMEQNVCGDGGVVSAVYESEASNRVKVTCGTGGATEFGAGMGTAGIAAGGLIFLVALGSSGGGATTTTTTGSN